MAQVPRDPRGFRTTSVWWPLARQILLFAAGLTLLLIEVLTHDEPRTPVLLVSFALLGLPVAQIFNRAVGE